MGKSVIEIEQQMVGSTQRASSLPSRPANVPTSPMATPAPRRPA